MEDDMDMMTDPDWGDRMRYERRYGSTDKEDYKTNPVAPKLAEEHTLYILMRTDMASMNAGKAMAQAAHAGQMFQDDLSMEKNATYRKEFNEDRSFGRTLVLDMWNGEELETMVKRLQDAGFMADVVLDPTYPIRDGRVTHAVPVITCGYIFVPKDWVIPLELTEMRLHY